MTIDMELEVRDGTTDLTADETSAAIDLGPAPHSGNFTLHVIVPEAGASDTLDVILKECATSGGSYVEFARFAQITKAMVDAGTTSYAHRFTNTERYVKVTFDVGASDDFGAVKAYIENNAYPVRRRDGS